VFLTEQFDVFFACSYSIRRIFYFCNYINHSHRSLVCFSRIFYPCISCAPFSSFAFSTPAFLTTFVPKIPTRKFQSRIFSATGVRPAQRLTVTEGGRMSVARRHRALSVFLELKVANFALLLSVRQTENRINVCEMYASYAKIHIYSAYFCICDHTFSIFFLSNVFLRLLNILAANDCQCLQLDIE